MRHTVMSYTWPDVNTTSTYANTANHVVAPMALDIGAIQHMYGSVPNLEGDTRFILTDPGSTDLDIVGDDGTIEIGAAWMGIWDSDGDDDRLEYDGNNRAILNLNAASMVLAGGGPGFLSLKEDMQDVDLESELDPTQWDDMSDEMEVGAGPTSHLMEAGTKTHMGGGFNIANDVIIENALGGDGDDFLIGNHHDNSLKGRDGDDFILGGEGNDEIQGGDGTNTLHGGMGNDTVRYERWEWEDDDEEDEIWPEEPMSLSDFRENSDVAGAIQYLFINLGDSAFDSTDTIKEIERILLTHRADKVEVNDYLLTGTFDDILIDFNRFAPETVNSDDFDHVDFSAVTTGITWVDGQVSVKTSDNGLIEQSFSGKLFELGNFLFNILGLWPEIVLTRSGATASNAQFVGAHKITGTSRDDTFYIDSSHNPESYFTGDGWQAETQSAASPEWGEVYGGDGNDTITWWYGGVQQPNQRIGESEGGWLGDGLTRAGQEFRAKAYGGDGTDRLFAVGGEGTVLVGGKGTDLLWSSAIKGQLWGGEENQGGDGELDIFWFWPGVFVMDAERMDVLELFGIPAGGGTNLPIMGADAASVLAFLASVAQGSIAMDWTLPFLFYGRTTSNQLLVYNQLYDILGIGNDPDVPEDLVGAMIVQDYDQGAYVDTKWAIPEEGDLGMVFRTFGGGGDQELTISPFTLMWGGVIALLEGLMSFAKNINWSPADDPLVLDLDGDGIETIQREDGVYFDMDGDFFAEQSGWVAPDDGFLVVDWNGNGRIDDITEMFGAPGLAGFDELAQHDSNADGVIDAADDVWERLRVWRDFDQDGQTDPGDLFTLGQLGIVSFDLAGVQPIEGKEVFDNVFAAGSTFTRGDGTTGEIAEVLFDTNRADSIYRGERGIAPWAEAAGAPDGKGIGSMANLGVALSNDPWLLRTVMDATAGMTVPDLADIREKATPVFGQWSQSLNRTRELTPVLIGADDTLEDWAVWVEDGAGGWFELASGAPVLDGLGAVIDRPTMADVLAQGAGWQVEALWSPQTREEALTHREAAPYLVEIVDDRQVVRDWGVEQPDGTWLLASGTQITAADGTLIAAPTVADILAMTAPEGQEWRQESLGFNPYADPPVDSIAINFIDGEVVDYSVEVTDEDGTFHVWARNLDRALELQDKLGRAGDFKLRNFEIDFQNLDELGSTDDSALPGGDGHGGAAALAPPRSSASRSSRRSCRRRPTPSRA